MAQNVEFLYDLLRNPFANNYPHHIFAHIHLHHISRNLTQDFYASFTPMHPPVSNMGFQQNLLTLNWQHHHVTNIHNRQQYFAKQLNFEK